jgi:hypothetical protein
MRRRFFLTLFHLCTDLVHRQDRQIALRLMGGGARTRQARKLPRVNTQTAMAAWRDVGFLAKMLAAAD